MNGDEDKKIRALDLKIAKALQIDVPPLVMPELPKIADDKVRALPQRRRSAKPVWFAIAASVVLATSIAIRMSGPFEPHDSLAAEVLAHLDHEPQAMRIVDAPVADERLRRTVPANMAVFDRDESLITYARICVINGKKVPHLVVQGQHGPVMILLMPDEKVVDVTPVEGESVHGLIIPVGDGSIAVVGDREEALEPIRKNVVDSITWTT
jgi:hypothetical protein